jgi:hypothetical protein
MDMIAETPARSILKVNEWGASKMYKVVCECGSDDCTHTVDIEAEDTGVTVTIYTKTRTNFWSMNRWQHIWTLLTKGHVDFETNIHLSEQSALNYSETLKQAVYDVKNFKKPLP